MGALYNNEFLNIKKSITNEDIQKLENKYKFIFPKDIREHYLTFNGGQPDKNIFVDDGYEYVISYFIPIKFGANKRTLETVLGIFRDDEDFPTWLIPFADEPGGDLYCFSIASDDAGAIYYWDHECVDNPEESYGYLAESIKVFIEQMLTDE